MEGWWGGGVGGGGVAVERVAPTRVARVTKWRREMLASRDFWMYRQSNSTPLAAVV